MSELTPQQRKNANWLLQYSKGKPEDSVRARILAILDSLGIENEAGYEPPGADGPSDIYLPRRRTFIETKAVGLADDPNKPQAREKNESPKQQLERYLRAEVEYELGCLALEGKTDRPWVGIVTDGRVWHVWRYAHEENAPSITVEEGFRPANAEELIARLRGFLEGDLVGKPWIPAEPVKIFVPFLEELREIHSGLRGPPADRTRTKRALWLDMLRTSSMEPGNEAAVQRLFVAHTFLVALARGVVYALENEQQGAQPPEPKEVLGDGFVAWVIDTVQARRWAMELLRKIASYEWRRRPGDVLRPLYERFVDETDRKVFGEFYTPDWLAELIVREICDDAWCDQAATEALSAHRKGIDVTGKGVLDPTCGSGTFLYFAAKRLLNAMDRQHALNSQKAAAVCLLVHGIDIHPVAAEIARATLLRALPAEPPRGKLSLRIHEGDALMLHGGGALFRQSDDLIHISTPQGREISLPRAFADQPAFADDLRRLIESAIGHVPLPADILAVLKEEDQEVVRKCHEAFQEIVQEEGNSVWTWFIRNITGPHRLSRKKVDRIVANPPWVKMSAIQAKRRKADLEAFAARDDIDLWAGGKQAPHLDIAQLFVKSCRQEYLQSPDADPAAWLVKKSALRGGNWQKFRNWHHEDEVLAQTLDLEKLQPFGGGDARRSCVLFERRPSMLGPADTTHLVCDKQGRKRLAHTQRLSQVNDRLVFRPAPVDVPQGSSEYVNARGEPLCRQGATITPKVLTVFREYVLVHEVGDDKDAQIRITTEPSQKGAWADIDQQTGQIPYRWKRPLIPSQILLPFQLNTASEWFAIVPINSEDRLEAEPGRESSFWRTLEDLYHDNKGEGGKAIETLIAQIDYGSKLQKQLHPPDNQKRMVIYPRSGDIMRACRALARDGSAILDSTLYGLEVLSEEEAAYLVALLNAPCLNYAFLQSRTSGRDFHKGPLRRVPIRRYDPGNPQHVALAELTAHAETLVEEYLAKPEAQADRRSQPYLSKRVRALLEREGVFTEIDCIARNLLPEQAATA